MAQEDVHHLSDAGLALGLSLGGGGASEAAAAHHGTTTTGSRPRSRASPLCPLEPSLTLSMPDEATATGSGGGGGAHSVSSLSVGGGGGGVKRERVEEAETTTGERASSTAALRSTTTGAGAEDDDDGSTRKKLRLTKEQSALLEDRFKEHSTLNPKQKVALAKQLNLRPRQVEVWFQNRRASRTRRTKLKQTEVDCEFLKRCCETLTEENRRLQRELQELRALKFAVAPPVATSPGATATAAAPPFYMQLPAATLSICPSCDRLGGPGAAGKADPDRPGNKKAAGTVVRTTAAHHFFNPFTHSAAC